MEITSNFAEILEAADKLSLADQEELIGVLRHRVAERRRDLLATEIQQARREFEVGQCQSRSPADILKAVAPDSDLERSGQGLATLAGGWPRLI